MQREKASAFWTFVDPAAYARLPVPMDGGLAPHAAASRTSAAVATDGFRDLDGHVSRDQYMTWVP
jgi:hypothetical protein